MEDLLVAVIYFLLFWDCTGIIKRETWMFLRISLKSHRTQVQVSRPLLFPLMSAWSLKPSPLYELFRLCLFDSSADSSALGWLSLCSLLWFRGGSHWSGHTVKEHKSECVTDNRLITWKLYFESPFDVTVTGACSSEGAMFTVACM